jgi:beta-lactam-binding protein with PASTA domain
MTVHYSILIFFLASINGNFELRRQSGLGIKSNSPISVSKKEDDKLTQKSISVPNIIGMTVEEAERVLRNKRLGIGAIIYGSESNVDSLKSLIIYKQNPSAKNSKDVQNYIRKGQLVDVWTASSKVSGDTLKQSNKRKTSHDY